LTVLPLPRYAMPSRHYFDFACCADAIAIIAAATRYARRLPPPCRFYAISRDGILPFQRATRRAPPAFFMMMAMLTRFAPPPPRDAPRFCPPGAP